MVLLKQTNLWFYEFNLCLSTLLLSCLEELIFHKTRRVKTKTKLVQTKLPPDSLLYHAQLCNTILITMAEVTLNFMAHSVSSHSDQISCGICNWTSCSAEQSLLSLLSWLQGVNAYPPELSSHQFLLKDWILESDTPAKSSELALHCFLWV